ncbi:MAG: hypothetical protein L6N96_05005 [Candidatus Methylarchaceae archaeon HK02M2]|nr:hypothetical protein [Candidatus Methylarchaceae archaeon HK02M2]
MRLDLSEEKVLSTRDVLEIIFPNKKTRIASRIFLDWLKERGGQATKNAVSNFANALQDEKFSNKGIPIKYSRRNFYMTILRNLINLGFIQRNVPIWDDRSRRTLYVYMRNIFDIPQKPPSVGFWRISYYICRKWNNEWEHGED